MLEEEVAGASLAGSATLDSSSLSFFDNVPHVLGGIPGGRQLPRVTRYPYLSLGYLLPIESMP